MNVAPDAVLLEQFARNDSEEAFSEIVRRHIGLVHSVALRQTQNTQHAEEITQAVFIILARKAASLGSKTILSGWLYHTARLTTANFQRAEVRRVHRERKAFMQPTAQDEQIESAWQDMGPLLEEAMAKLKTTDRDAIVLRYFENKTLREVGSAMGLQERAAQKRVARGLEKLRAFFTKHGVVLSATVIAGAVSANSVKAASPALAASVKAVAFGQGSAAAASTLTLVKGALKIMAWTKAKLVVAAGVGVLVAAGTTMAIIKETQPPPQIGVVIDESFWQADSRILYKVPPVLIIRPTKSPGLPGGLDAGDRVIMIDAPISRLLSVAYSFPETRLALPRNLTDARFDLMLTLANHPRESLREEIKRRFGLVGQAEEQTTNMLLLKIKNTDAPGLKFIRAGDPIMSPGEAQSRSERLSTKQTRLMIIPKTTIANFLIDLETKLGKQIKDETGISNYFQVQLQWKTQGGETENDALKRAVVEQLGLELVPTNMPIEMLVVKKEN